MRCQQPTVQHGICGRPHSTCFRKRQHSTSCEPTSSYLHPAGDLSRNNWWVAALAFGEGWHNSHHAFAHSARHGLEWYEIDICYYCICALEAVGLVWDIRVPTEAEKERKRQPDQKQKIW